MPRLNSEAALLERCLEIQGITFAALAQRLNLYIPINPVRRKGWVGQAVELALGTTAGARAIPDFHELNIELKTIPVDKVGRPAESTFVTSIPLLTLHEQTWETSQCYGKLRRVLWLPIEHDKDIPFTHRRIGLAKLWSPSPQETAVLEKDWSELSFLVIQGKLAELTSNMGEYLQVRPKASNARALCYGYDEAGERILTLPRGFYLRRSFTERCIASTGV